jgi:hypothetical protein
VKIEITLEKGGRSCLIKENDQYKDVKATRVGGLAGVLHHQKATAPPPHTPALIIT